MPLSLQKNLLEIEILRGLAEVPKGLVTLVLAPVLCQEPLFRGLVLTSFYAHYGPRWALGGSALLFAISHFNPWQLIPLFLFGLFLGALVYWTHSIYPPMLAHAVNNMHLLRHGWHRPFPTSPHALGPALRSRPTGRSPTSQPPTRHYAAAD